MLNRIILLVFLGSIFSCFAMAQHTSDGPEQKLLKRYQDSLMLLGKQVVNNENDVERKSSNYEYIKLLVTALKVPHSFEFPFDSLKNISITNSPDHKFRIFTWPVMNKDGSYRFYGAVQMNSDGPLVLHPLEDLSPMIKNPEDSVTTSRNWFGAEYYKIIPVYAKQPYYVLLGWKGNNVKTTKKVIEVLSFEGGKPVWGKQVFENNNKLHNRIVFEYSRQASMLLRYVPEQNLIVFDHITASDKKMEGQYESYGPDLTYDGYRLTNGKWRLVSNIDMRNIPSVNDAVIEDPKQQARRDHAAAAASMRSH